MKQLTALLFVLIAILNIWTVQACTANARDCRTPSGCMIRTWGDVCFTRGGHRCVFPAKIGPDNYYYA